MPVQTSFVCEHIGGKNNFTDYVTPVLVVCLKLEKWNVPKGGCFLEIQQSKIFFSENTPWEESETLWKQITIHKISYDKEQKNKNVFYAICEWEKKGVQLLSELWKQCEKPLGVKSIRVYLRVNKTLKSQESSLPEYIRQKGRQLKIRIKEPEWQ